MPDLTQEGLAARGLRVRELVFSDCSAPSPFGDYYYFPSMIKGEGFWYGAAGEVAKKKAKTEAEAIAILKADYAARILAALEDTGELALIRHAETRGMERAAKLVDKRAEEYDREFGIYDYTTGVTEYPGTGSESMEEWESISADIRAAAAALRKDEETPK